MHMPSASHIAQTQVPSALELLVVLLPSRRTTAHTHYTLYTLSDTTLIRFKGGFIVWALVPCHTLWHSARTFQVQKECVQPNNSVGAQGNVVPATPNAPPKPARSTAGPGQTQPKRGRSGHRLWIWDLGSGRHSGKRCPATTAACSVNVTAIPRGAAAPPHTAGNQR